MKETNIYKDMVEFTNDRTHDIHDVSDVINRWMLREETTRRQNQTYAALRRRFTPVFNAFDRRFRNSLASLLDCEDLDDYAVILGKEILFNARRTDEGASADIWALRRDFFEYVANMTD